MVEIETDCVRDGEVLPENELVPELHGDVVNDAMTVAIVCVGDNEPVMHTDAVSDVVPVREIEGDPEPENGVVPERELDGEPDVVCAYATRRRDDNSNKASKAVPRPRLKEIMGLCSQTPATRSKNKQGKNFSVSFYSDITTLKPYKRAQRGSFASFGGARSARCAMRGKGVSE